MRRNTRSSEPEPADTSSAAAAANRGPARETRDLKILDQGVRRRIEATALQAFSEQEMHRVNISELAARAKTSLQTVYRYYGGKQGLLLAVLDHELSELAARVADYMRTSHSYKERLRIVFWVVLEHFEHKPQVAAVLHRSLFEQPPANRVTSQEPDLTVVLTRIIEEGRVQGALTDEVEQRVLLDFFWGVLWRFTRTSMASGGTRLSVEDANASFELLWRAMSRAPGVNAVGAAGSP